MHILISARAVASLLRPSRELDQMDPTLIYERQKYIISWFKDNNNR